MDITYQNIYFKYARQNVLQNLNGRLQSGLFYALVGPNGSGKSTFLKCLSGLLKPCKGQITLDDLNLNAYSARRLAQRLAYVPQMFEPVYPTDVYHTILLGRKPHLAWQPGQSDKAIVEAILNDFRLTNLATKAINHLSGGEQQRVHIARAIAQQPKVLLLDEPTSKLDLKYQLELMQLLKQITARNITIVIAIHDLNLALRFADQFVLLRKGQILAQGGQGVLSEENLSLLYDVAIKKITYNKHSYILPV